MDVDSTFNSTLIATDIHPCYELQNKSVTFAGHPSVACVLVYVFLALLSFATICGNLIVIFAIIYFRQLHTPTNYLILSLAVADLLVGVLVFPFSMAFTVTSCMFTYDIFCQIRDSFDVALCTSSILNLCCISIDRYYAVCQPLTYTVKMSVPVTAGMILVTWTISALIGIGIIVAGFSQGSCEEACTVDMVLANTMGPVFSFYVPAIIMVSIYFKIFLVALQQAKSIQSSMSRAGVVSKMEKKATKSLATVMGIFLLCMTPYFLCIVFQPLAHYPPPTPVIEALNWLTLANSMLNPLIYAFFYKWFRSAFKIVVSGKILQGNFSNTTLM